jgi:hypothetical protein
MGLTVHNDVERGRGRGRHRPLALTDPAVTDIVQGEGRFAYSSAKVELTWHSM